MESASKDILLGALVELLNEKEFKKDFVKRVNEHVDVPMINEKTEQKVINTLYKLMVDQVERAAEKIKKMIEYIYIMLKNTELRKYGLECVGTIFFLFVILLTGNPLAIGLALALMIYIAGPITGGHFNPAVSIMMYANKKLSMKDTLMYIVAQVLGGLAALIIFRMM